MNVVCAGTYTDLVSKPPHEVLLPYQKHTNSPEAESFETIQHHFCIGDLNSKPVPYSDHGDLLAL